MRRFALVLLLALPLFACGEQGSRAPFADSRAPPGLERRFLPPAGWAWGYVQVGEDAVQRYGVSAPHGAATGQVLILTDYGESAETWFETARDLNAKGVVVWILERQAQGGSERLTARRDRGHVESYAPDVTATKAMVRVVIRPDGRLPLTVLGQGQGGLVALRAVEEGLMVDTLVLSAPVFELSALPRPKGQLIEAAQWARRLRLSSRAWPGATDWRRDGPDDRALGLTGDATRGAVNHAWQTANPDLRMGAPSLGLYAAFYEVLDVTARDLSRVKTPVVLLAGEADAVTPPFAQESVCKALADCRQVRLAGGRHALHLERDSVRTLWLEAVLGAIRAAGRPAPATP
ncbi:alpha/beta hydrolase [Caulobacter flavus]|uniref:Alpha/beta hydrolase n=1 Tax=Caulobacter flavus TaxID=1679497 RepID=A0A2N5CM58_9CAUL|nr:alpha/beta hydrolase [Caulobacter flavus]AYV48087.1 alpha/beta hydrolase [Caulobacter flavus]PLR06988.1 alpha/beta hydrolase [Caulobacter flavus]